MKKIRALIAAVVSIAVIVCALSVSSLAGLAPFGFFLGEEATVLPEPETTEPVTAPETSVTAERESSAAEEPSDKAAAETTTEPAPKEETVCMQTSEAAEAPAEETTADPLESVPGTGEQEKPKREARLAAAAPENNSLALNTDINGALASAFSVKTYDLTLSARGVLRYVFTHPATDSDAAWIVSLYQKYNANGFDGEECWRLLNVLETSAAKTAEHSPFIGLQKGEYRITVEAGQTFSAASFTLKAEFTPGASYEIEYNDTPARYTEICPGVPVRGSANSLKDAYDTDYYMFRVPSSGKVGISFAHTRIDTVSVYWRVVLFDENGTELYAENSLGSSEQLFSGEIGLAPGCYFVGVFGRVYTDFDYTLTVTRQYDGAFETEPNGTTENADVLELDSSVSGALIASSGSADTDIFAVRITQPGYIKLRFTVPEGKEEDYCWRLTFSEASGRRIRECVVSPSAPEENTAPIGVGVGTYYITVDNGALYKNNATYTLSNEFTATTSWEREYNGSPADATPITADVGMNGTITDCEAEFDDDYFRFTLAAPAFVRVNLYHEAAGGDKNIFAVSVLDENGKAVQLFDEQAGAGMVSEGGVPITIFHSAENTENVSAGYALKAGTYSIRVTSGLFSSDIRYILTFTSKTGGQS